MKKRKRIKPAMIATYLLLTVLALVVVVPFVWFVSTSFDYVKSWRRARS